ncbi:MAG TPA: metal-sensitive transcriptional regulator [Opitutales bacterium]|jgi:DNA-binding FrmR family transcriptional regulator|nr:metal-sensitive transcriptional regulator [Opitutales bacterium]
MPSKTSLPSQKEKSLKLAKQARGTLDTVISMIEDNAYCPEIIQQTGSVVGLLQSVERELLAGHLDTCVARRLKENKGEAIRELMKIYRLSH